MNFGIVLFFFCLAFAIIYPVLMVFIWGKVIKYDKMVIEASEQEEKDEHRKKAEFWLKWAKWLDISC